MKTATTCAAPAPDIINTYDQLLAAAGDHIAIMYLPAENGRAARLARWVVVRVVNGREKVTDPEAHWRDNQHKVFRVPCRTDKAPRLAEAIAWCNSKYGAREYARNRLGDWVEADVNARFPIPKRNTKKGAPPQNTRAAIDDADPPF